MATSLNVTVSRSIAGLYRNLLATTTPQNALRYVKSHQFVDGSDANEANKIWIRQLTVTQSTQTLDLTSGMEDDFGTALVFTKLKYYWFENLSTTNGDFVTVTGNFTIANFNGGPVSQLIPGSGHTQNSSPITGWSVVNGTSDTFTFVGQAVSNLLDVVLIGVG